MTNIKWNYEKRKIDELKPHPLNPRKFTKKGLSDLKNSINKIGMAQPINITPDGTILSGHARLETLKNNGVKEVDVFVANRELTDEEQKEILVRMNANTVGEWVIEDLVANFELPDLKEWGLDDLNISFDVDEEDIIEPEVKKREKKMFCCPNCGHVNVKKAFEQADSGSY